MIHSHPYGKSTEDILVDNFMDKLAKRFNAGEIIKANAQAEARDLKKMQERTAEYERMMQEMRRLNLKNVEVTEQVQQLIQCGIEQIEGYGSGEELLLNKMSENGEAVNTGLNEVKESMYGRLDELEQSLSGAAGQNNEAFLTALKELENKLAATDNMEGLLARMETVISSDRYTMEAKLDEMSGLVRNMEENVSRMEGSLQQIREILVAVRIGVEEGQKRLEDHVHKENVRVYRNVQAAVSEEATKKARDLGERIDRIESSVKKSSGVKPLLIITFLLVLASVGIQVAQLLQLF